MLALTGDVRLWEVKRLRLRLLSAAARLTTTGRRRVLKLARAWALDTPDHRSTRPAAVTPPPRLNPTDQHKPRDLWKLGVHRHDSRATAMPTPKNTTPTNTDASSAS